ncbi:MAG: DUF3263 domain-containing protein [Microbacteriaceae bacterium]|nr:DUF3263 domain-containing protein [Microbacteriaceae bacterium]MBT7803448.1 DUF3263 domain-containing protein [Microbacteriaceae bacterium]
MSTHNTSAQGLPAQDREILEFERRLWGPTPNKESAVREAFGLSLARYYQRVYAICRTEQALEYDAVLVRQCQEAAQLRGAARST